MNNESIDQQLADNKEIDIKAIAVKFGLIGGLAGILISLVLFFANMQYENWAKWLQSAVLIIAILLGLKNIADANKNKEISFGTLFKGGMLITLVFTIISVVYFLVYSNFIESNFIDKILEVSRKQMEEKGLSENQIDQAISISRKFMSPAIMSVISFISSLIIGALISLAGAAAFKKEK